jgi:hypothetical protein
MFKLLSYNLGAASLAFGEAPPLRYGFAIAHTFMPSAFRYSGKPPPFASLALIRFISYQVKYLSAFRSNGFGLGEGGV